MAATIGLLALQGGYAAHGRSLHTLGVETQEVRCADDLKGLDGLVLPGGESTTQIKLLNWFELWDPLHEFLTSGAPVLATCAGMILLANTVQNPAQASYGLLDIDVSRNGWGRQVHSAEAVADLESTTSTFGEAPLSLLFIRAPRVTRVGNGVDVLASIAGEPVMVQQGALCAATFHPELTEDLRVHRHAFRTLL